MISTTTKLVAFVDILGFSKIIERFDKGEIPQILSDLKEAIDPAARFVKKDHENIPSGPFFDWKECLDVRLFSDCLCAAAPLEYKGYDFLLQLKFFYQYLMGYQLILMEKGFFTRGAVTIGSHYADENMIFSGGLVEAYRLETKKAKFPRIIASEILVNNVRRIAPIYPDVINHMFVVDNEETIFLNQFNYNLVDSKIADSMVSEMPIGSGIVYGSFEENDLREKKETLKGIMQITQREIDQNQENSVKEKHKWLLDFIKFELNGENDRGFRRFLD